MRAATTQVRRPPTTNDGRVARFMIRDECGGGDEPEASGSGANRENHRAPLLDVDLDAARCQCVSCSAENHSPLSSAKPEGTPGLDPGDTLLPPPAPDPS